MCVGPAMSPSLILGYPTTRADLGRYPYNGRQARKNEIRWKPDPGVTQLELVGGRRNLEPAADASIGVRLHAAHRPTATLADDAGASSAGRAHGSGGRGHGAGRRWGHGGCGRGGEGGALLRPAPAGLAALINGTRQARINATFGFLLGTITLPAAGVATDHQPVRVELVVVLAGGGPSRPPSTGQERARALLPCAHHQWCGAQVIRHPPKAVNIARTRRVEPDVLFRRR